MAALKDIDLQVRRTEFQVETAASLEAIYRAAETAREASRRVGFHKVIETEPGEADDPDAWRYAVISGVTVAEMTVAWVATGPSTFRLTFTVDDYLVTRATIAGFIPAGPRRALGLAALQRFSSTFRSLLSES